MKRVTLDKRLFRAVIIIVVIAGIMPFFFRSWDNLFILENLTNESGLKNISAGNNTCEFECCESGPVIKYCKGNMKCEGNKCVKKKCPFECCPGTDFIRKDCNKGFACVNNVCRYAKELCGNGECDEDHLECEYCKDECMFDHPDGTSAALNYYWNETGTCRPYINPENVEWFIDPDDKLVEVTVDSNILSLPGHMWSYFELAQQWVIENIEDNESDVPYPTPTETLVKRKGGDRERAFLMTSMFLDIVQKAGLFQYENSTNTTYEIKAISFPTEDGEHYFVVVQFDGFQSIYDTNEVFTKMAYTNQEVVEVWDELFMKYGVISPKAEKQMSHDYLVYQKSYGGKYMLPFIYIGNPVDIELTQQRNSTAEEI